MPLLKAGGRIYHGGYVDGLTITEAGDEDYEDAGRYGDGVLVAGVDEGSRTDKAGIRPGDIISKIGPYRAFNKNRFFGIAQSHPLGAKVKVRYLRKTEKGWKEHEGEIVLGDPEAPLEGAHVFREIRFGFGPAYAQKGDGIRINSLTKEGPAEKAGLRPGDTVVEADGAQV